MRNGMLALALLLFALTPGVAAQNPKDAGPKVGERVPDFALLDQTGRTVTLESLLRSKGAMVVFHRSADW